VSFAMIAPGEILFVGRELVVAEQPRRGAPVARDQREHAGDDRAALHFTSLHFTS